MKFNSSDLTFIEYKIKFTIIIFARNFIIDPLLIFVLSNTTILIFINQLMYVMNQLFFNSSNLIYRNC